MAVGLHLDEMPVIPYSVVILVYLDVHRIKVYKISIDCAASRHWLLLRKDGPKASLLVKLAGHCDLSRQSCLKLRSWLLSFKKREFSCCSSEILSLGSDYG